MSDQPLAIAFAVIALAIACTFVGLLVALPMLLYRRLQRAGPDATSPNNPDATEEPSLEEILKAMKVWHKQALDQAVDDLKTRVDAVNAQMSQFTDILGWATIVNGLERMPRDDAERFIEETLTWPVVFDKVGILDRSTRAELLRVLLRPPRPLAFLQVTEESFTLESADDGQSRVYHDPSVYRNTMRALYDNTRIDDIMDMELAE